MSNLGIELNQDWLDLYSKHEVQPTPLPEVEVKQNKLTNQQRKAVDEVSKFIRKSNKPEFKVRGYAGTGKTELVKHLTNTLSNVTVNTFTGKAASVLRHRGVQASTIHSLIYFYDKPKDKFFLREPWELGGINTIIIDEASMISEELWKDLTFFQKPIIWIGDPGQLPPIGKDIHLMKQPDIVLDEIHRQAAGSEIISLATDIRSGSPGTTAMDVRQHGEWEGLYVGYRRDYYALASQDVADIYICGYNKTRTAVNQLVREARGFIPEIVQEGDRLIVLRNDKNLGIWNGLIITVKEIVEEIGSLSYLMKVEDELGEIRTLPVWIGGVGEEKIDMDVAWEEAPGQAIVDYGYCLTCHKAQGSGYPTVAVLQEGGRSWDMQRWSYTGTTRASNELYYCK